LELNLIKHETPRAVALRVSFRIIHRGLITSPDSFSFRSADPLAPSGHRPLHLYTRIFWLRHLLARPESHLVGVASSRIASDKGILSHPRQTCQAPSFGSIPKDGGPSGPNLISKPPRRVAYLLWILL
jgi:hypothetical protein